MSARYSPSRAKRLVQWSRPWYAFKAKQPEPDEPSTGRLLEELGEQLEAAGRVIDRLLSLLPEEQRLAELHRINTGRYP